MSLQDGNWTFYILEARVKAESLWGELEPVEPIQDDIWCIASPDYFAFDYDYETWGNTGYYGWEDYEEGYNQLEKMRRRDSNGDFDYVDNYGHKEQVTRYEFRLVKVHITKETTITY